MYRIRHVIVCAFVLGLFAFFWPVLLFGQAKNINVTVYRVEDLNKIGSKKPWNNQNVYGFFSAGKANKFLEKCKNAKGEYLFHTEDDYDAMGVTDVEGTCELQLPLSGFIIIVPPGAEIKMVAIKGRLNVDVNVVEGKVLKGTTVKATRPRGPEPQIPNSCGNRLEFDYQLPLASDQVDVRSRIVLKPLVVAIEKGDTTEVGDTLGYMSPYVKDGVEFSKANLRRMGFDETRDPLYRYRVGLMRESHQKDSMAIHFVLQPVDKRYRYKVTADMVFGMNMKTPYRIDSICLTEGYVRDPMRFLDYDVIEVPIDRTLYARRGKAEFSKDHEKLYLNFLQGEAKLDPADTANVAQLEKLKQNMGRYMSADAGITGAVIHGSASPEGGIAFNERLCHKRAEFVRQELSALPALQEARRSGEVKTTAKVATWEDVANQLAADSLAAEAEMVRSVLRAAKDTRRQEEHIRKLPCWPVIETRILPKFRYVDIEYFYYTNRVKTKEEIWEQYQNDPEYHAGKRQVPYEFYQLLDMIKDPVEKEPIARAAYESVKDEDGARAWPLAAYELAQCYLERDHVDTTLLKPYLDSTAYRRFYHKQDFDTESYVGWYNDPAIVTTHVNMLCKAGDFAAAYRCAFKYLPDEPKYKKLQMFLRCLNCEWDDPEVMDTVSNSSYWNNVVILAAQQDLSSKENALFMLNNASQVNQADPKALYMKAQLLFNLYGKQQKSTVGYQDANFMVDEFFEPSSEDPYMDAQGFALINWGLPMAQCCAIDESFFDIMLFDGEFNDDYRKAFKAYWRKVKSGALPRPALPETTAQPGVVDEEEQTEQDLLDEAFGIEN